MNLCLHFIITYRLNSIVTLKSNEGNPSNRWTRESISEGQMFLKSVFAHLWSRVSGENTLLEGYEKSQKSNLYANRRKNVHNGRSLQQVDRLWHKIWIDISVACHISANKHASILRLWWDFVLLMAPNEKQIKGDTDKLTMPQKF